MSRTNFAAKSSITSRRTPLAAPLAATFTAALAILATGCATTPRQQSLDAAKLAANQKPVSTIGCTHDTGSRIQRKEGQCSGPGRTYTQEDLQRTGDFNAADALRRLDPSFQ